MLTHDTFVIGFNNDKITFIKSYDYLSQKEECQRDLGIIQDKKSGYTGWLLSHVGGWKLERKNDETEQFEIDIQLK